MVTTRIDAVLATLGHQAAQAHDQIDRAERMAHETDRLRVTGRSADGLAVAVVDGVGQLLSVDLARGAGDTRPARLGAAVLEAYRQAQRRLAGEVSRLGEEIYGAGSPSVALLADGYRRRFGDEVGR